MSGVTRCIKASDYFTTRVIVLSVPYKSDWRQVYSDRKFNKIVRSSIVRARGC